MKDETSTKPIMAATRPTVMLLAAIGLAACGSDDSKPDQVLYIEGLGGGGTIELVVPETIGIAREGNSPAVSSEEGFESRGFVIDEVGARCIGIESVEMTDRGFDIELGDDITGYLLGLPDASTFDLVISWYRDIPDSGDLVLERARYRVSGTTEVQTVSGEASESPRIISPEELNIDSGSFVSASTDDADGCEHLRRPLDADSDGITNLQELNAGLSVEDAEDDKVPFAPGLDSSTANVDVVLRQAASIELDSRLTEARTLDGSLIVLEDGSYAGLPVRLQADSEGMVVRIETYVVGDTSANIPLALRVGTDPRPADDACAMLTDPASVPELDGTSAEGVFRSGDGFLLRCAVAVAQGSRAEVRIELFETVSVRVRAIRDEIAAVTATASDANERQDIAIAKSAIPTASDVIEKISDLAMLEDGDPGLVSEDDAGRVRDAQNAMNSLTDIEPDPALEEIVRVVTAAVQTAEDILGTDDPSGLAVAAEVEAIRAGSRYSGTLLALPPAASGS